MGNLSGRMPTRGIQNPIPTKIQDTSTNVATKMTVNGSITYIATAAPGTPQSTAAWQVRKIDETSGLVITWCDGNTLFDNVATDLTSLSYS